MSIHVNTRGLEWHCLNFSHPLLNEQHVLMSPICLALWFSEHLLLHLLGEINASASSFDQRIYIQYNITLLTINNHNFMYIYTDFALMRAMLSLFHSIKGQHIIFLLWADTELWQVGWEHTSEYIPWNSYGSPSLRRGFSHPVHCIRTCD